MSDSLDPKELKILSDILALVLEDNPGQSENALAAIRTRARKNQMTGGALKNLFAAIAPNPPPARRPSHAPRAAVGQVPRRRAKSRIHTPVFPKWPTASARWTTNCATHAS
ncbi:hypothetical protein [Novacetimonas hansenii]|uniref:hypothetical protein n=1 Tax=Novacetimonas hansenii TaxID=436 RepID=UPI0026913DDE